MSTTIMGKMLYAPDFVCEVESGGVVHRCSGLNAVVVASRLTADVNDENKDGGGEKRRRRRR